jgi:endonuclease-3
MHINKERINKILDILDEEYKEAECSLAYEKPYELLIAARLSAQCTDERVNMVTPALFARYPTLEAFACAEPEDVMDMVHSCGFYRTKGQSIVDMSRMLISDYGGKIPNTIDELIKLPGIGRKTANLIVGDIYKKPAIVADTHCIRLSNRLGLCNSSDPEKVEMTLKKLLPSKRQTRFCHQLVWHGRKVCMARNPDCSRCALSELCSYFTMQQKQ